MSGDRPEAGGAAAREEELLRINAELAAEIRSLGARRASGPRSTAGSSARRLSQALAEREELLAERERLKGEVRELRFRCESLEGEVKGLDLHRIELAAEVERLRGGAAGIVRRALARIRRR